MDVFVEALGKAEELWAQRMRLLIEEASEAIAYRTISLLAKSLK